MFHDTKSFRAENEVPREKVPEDTLSKGDPQDCKDEHSRQREPAGQVEPDGRAEAPPRSDARQDPVTRRHQPLWSSA